MECNEHYGLIKLTRTIISPFTCTSRSRNWRMNDRKLLSWNFRSSWCATFSSNSPAALASLSFSSISNCSCFSCEFALEIRSGPIGLVRGLLCVTDDRLAASLLMRVVCSYSASSDRSCLSDCSNSAWTASKARSRASTSKSSSCGWRVGACRAPRDNGWCSWWLNLGKPFDIEYLLIVGISSWAGCSYHLSTTSPCKPTCSSIWDCDVDCAGTSFKCKLWKSEAQFGTGGGTSNGAAGWIDPLGPKGSWCSCAPSKGLPALNTSNSASSKPAVRLDDERKP